MTWSERKRWCREDARRRRRSSQPREEDDGRREDVDAGGEAWPGRGGGVRLLGVGWAAPAPIRSGLGILVSGCLYT
jgi:hypothetical protein